ncbi:MAG: ArsR/SmtB family transcription factor, partial [Acidimicrobiales bacterium]
MVAKRTRARTRTRTRTPVALVTLRVLADPTRLRLFEAVRTKERCVSDLVATEKLAQPLVSHHLRVLAQAGLVQARRADGFTLYAVD